jgi:predicted metal-dependent HD superfamily phosphohydrolase
MVKSHLLMVQDYVTSLFTEKTPVINKYHNLSHTQEVVDSTIEIGLAEKLSLEDIEVVQIAAWFHDTGYVEKTAGHEELSAMFASNFLSEENYPANRIEKIIGCILATKVPQKPITLLQKIICDADLSHFGRETFFSRNDKYRLEVQSHTHHQLSDYEWLTQTIDFFTRHHFFTDYALNHFSKQKEKNLLMLQEQLDAVINQPK